MTKHLFIIHIYISIYLFACYHTQSNTRRDISMLSTCKWCTNCITNMSCNYSRWIGAWGLPNQSFIDNYTLGVVRTSSSCLNECLSNPVCFSFTSPTDSPTQCTLYSKPVNPLGELYNRTAFEIGTRICCTDIKNLGNIISPCLPCPNCTKLMQCNQTCYVVKPGLPDNKFISTYFLNKINATINCADECELNPNCLTFSYIVDRPRWCSLYSGVMGVTVIYNDTSEQMTGGKVCCGFQSWSVDERNFRMT
ncbi:unnamed protein product [Schistosoma rodhaini]|nr:unnamed protein product [Schistosoma rodhaini]